MCTRDSDHSTHFTRAYAFVRMLRLRIAFIGVRLVSVDWELLAC